MKNIFHGYYTPAAKEFDTLWNDAILSVDSNVLLNLYAYSAETTDEIIRLLGAWKDRIWISYQALRLGILPEYRPKTDSYYEIRELFGDHLLREGLQTDEIDGNDPAMLKAKRARARIAQQARSVMRGHEAREMSPDGLPSVVTSLEAAWAFSSHDRRSRTTSAATPLSRVTLRPHLKALRGGSTPRHLNQANHDSINCRRRRSRSSCFFFPHHISPESVPLLDIARRHRPCDDAGNAADYIRTIADTEETRTPPACS